MVGMVAFIHDQESYMLVMIIHLNRSCIHSAEQRIYSIPLVSIIYLKGTKKKTHIFSACAYTCVYPVCQPRNSEIRQFTISFFGLLISDNEGFNKLFKFGAAFYVIRGAPVPFQSIHS